MRRKELIMTYNGKRDPNSPVKPCFKTLVRGMTSGLAGALICATASAANWQYAGAADQNKEGAAIFVDPQSIKTSGSYLTAWTLTSFSRPQNQAGITFQSIRRLRYFDCRHEKVGAGRAEFIASVTGAGPVVRQVDIPADKVRLTAIEPGTPAETALKAVCRSEKT